MVVRAVVVDRPGPAAEVMRVRDLPAVPAGAGEVVVRVRAAGVNPVDVGNRADSAWAGVPSPYVVGYEFAGVVTDGGDPTGGLAVGDEVWGLLPVRGTRWGAYAEQVTLSASLVARRPGVVDDVSAAALPLAGVTALQVLDRLSLPAGASLLVHGASGGVGHLLLQLAAARGVRVIASSRSKDRTRNLQAGAAAWVDRDAESPAAVAAAELGQHLDGVADLVGGLLRSSLPWIREGGQGASIVDLAGDFEDAIDRNITLHGVLLSPSGQALRTLASAVQAGLRPEIAATYDLADAASAHVRLEAGAVGGRIVLTVDQDASRRSAESTEGR